MTARTAAAAAKAYAGNLEHLRDELGLLDLMIRLRVIEMRLASRALHEAAGQSPMYISHEEVDRLLAGNEPFDADDPELQTAAREIERLRKVIDAKIAGSIAEGVLLQLPRLARIFGLSPFEVHTLIICLAPELDRKYDKLYAYLQDDITRKKPSIDLVLGLLCSTGDERWRSRAYFAGAAPLVRSGMIQFSDDRQSPSGSSDLSKFLKLDPRILGCLLGSNSMDERVAHCLKLIACLPATERLLVAPAVVGKVLGIAQVHFDAKDTTRKRLVFHFRGAFGSGRRDLASAVCGMLCSPLLYLDLDLIAQEPDFETTLKGVMREGLLQQAAVYMDNIDSALGEAERARINAKKIEAVVSEYGWLVFLAGEKTWPDRRTFRNSAFHDIEFPAPDVPLREAAWKQALASVSPAPDPGTARVLANRFRLTPGEIMGAAENVMIMRGAGRGKTGTVLDDLSAACRSRSNQKLREVAVKVQPRCGWDDLVLPAEKTAQLREICCQVRHQYRVFTEWGFERKISHGKGLSVLFSGPPGTGKTLAAEVIARELGLDLYKIDLSAVVSKYIGETEKNLSQIFKEAETSNAILFFDEADALFGKRTEVSDAHDRYANIETSYLLQKMEEYEGVVILATNLQENIDDAFVRRIRCIIDFPFPDAESRRRIWKNHMPAEAPAGDDIDFGALSRRFQVSGGNIKNIVLTSAFLAAENGGSITMEHLQHGARREFEKMGKVWEERPAAASMTGRPGKEAL